MLGLIKSSPSIMMLINNELVTIDFQVFETWFGFNVRSYTIHGHLLSFFLHPEHFTITT